MISPHRLARKLRPDLKFTDFRYPPSVLSSQLLLREILPEGVESDSSHHPIEVMEKPPLLGLSQELIDGIVDCLAESRRDLLHLCTVNKKLRASARRYLYRRTSLGLYESPRLVMFIRTIIENPELRDLIRELIIRPAGAEADARMAAAQSYETWPHLQLDTSKVPAAELALVRVCQMECRSSAAYNLTTMLGLLFYFLPRLGHLDLYQVDISGCWDGMSKVVSHVVEQGPAEYRFLPALEALRLHAHYDISPNKYPGRRPPLSPIYYFLTLARPDVLHLKLEGTGYRMLNTLGEHQMMSARTIKVDDLGRATGQALLGFLNRCPRLTRLTIKVSPPYNWKSDDWVERNDEVTQYRLDSTLTEHCPRLEELVLQVNGKNIFFGADMVGRRLLNRLPEQQRLKKLHVQLESFFADPLEMDWNGAYFARALPAQLEDVFLDATTVSHAWAHTLFRKDPTRAIYRQGLKNVIASLARAHRAQRMCFKTVVLVAERVNHADLQREYDRDLWAGTSVRFLAADHKLGVLLWEKGVTSEWLEGQRVLVQ
ncbi:hypothetical protein CTA2_3820 [Colletotrichum tanaceti]|uniref:Uncharacterized protein n=1 Tax=Colletotrichum tanaceti TaxID=1306861 RepID=A0A4U6XEL1_9PEZI|nr:hypothetical protein CTA2_3820 [Colletotrichum tanaceti]TKW54250.1 hypothetical protein CTA1_8393 [Colletotrichum tanaceti]